MWNQWHTIFDPVMTADPLHAVTGDPSQNRVFCSLLLSSPYHHICTVRKHRDQLPYYNTYTNDNGMFTADRVPSMLCC